MLISPDIVEVWEGVLTLVWFVALILIAYGADINIVGRWRQRRIARAKEREAAAANELGAPLAEQEDEDPWRKLQTTGDPPTEAQLKEMERQIHLQFPGLPAEDLAKMLAYRIKMTQKHDRLWYRIQVTYITQFTSTYCM